MDNKYLYHCKGCEKPDKEFPAIDIDCEECEGSGGDCWKCNGYGVYMPTTPVEYHMWSRADAYGIYTGLYCDKCYDDPHKYTYRKDEYYDPAYAGERMEPDE